MRCTLPYILSSPYPLLLSSPSPSPSLSLSPSLSPDSVPTHASASAIDSKQHIYPRLLSLFSVRRRAAAHCWPRLFVALSEP